MSAAITKIDQFIATGNLDAMSDGDKTQYYLQLCASLGLNPATRPFDYIRLNGKLTLYAKRDATDQLRKRDEISVSVVRSEKVDDLFIVTARASTKDGRADESTGAVAIAGLKGEALANAMMKAETKAKRRATLSICGLGFSDETEIDSIPNAQRVEIKAAPQLQEVKAPELPAAPVASESDVERFAKAIDDASTSEEMAAVGAEIDKFFDKKDPARKALSQRYTKKFNDMAKAAKAEPAST